MILDVEAQSDVGCVREHNEDMILVGETLVRDAGASPSLAVADGVGRALLAVADGMGGGLAGEEASEIALTRVRQVMAAMPDDLDPEELAEVFATWARETHARLMALGASDPARAGMGTTVVGLLAYNGRGYRFHAGDSRLYRLRQGQLARLTRDHSVRELRGDTDSPSNLILNSLGGGADSWLEFAPLEGDLRPGDRYLLSSDGLHDLVPEATLAALLDGERGFTARTLVNLARTAGGKDNISVILADVRASQRP